AGPPRPAADVDGLTTVPARAALLRATARVAGRHGLRLGGCGSLLALALLLRLLADERLELADLLEELAAAGVELGRGTALLGQERVELALADVEVLAEGTEAVGVVAAALGEQARQGS